MNVTREEPPAPVHQPVLAPLTSAAIFLVVCIKPDRDSYAAVRSLCADLSGIFRAVDFRRIEGGLSCVAGFGSDAWDNLFGAPRPAELHPFREIQSGERHAVSTPADILFHIRAKRMDLCFELVTAIMDRIGGAVSAVDETHGFRYFDDRDLLGFVDGTENPRGEAALDAALVAAPIADAQFEQITAFIEEPVIVSAANRDLSELSTSVLVFEHGCPHRKRLEQWYAKRGIVPERIIELGSYHAMLGCVLAGMGIALVPKSVLPTVPESKRLKIHRLPRGENRYETLLIWRKGISSPNVQALREVFDKHGKRKSVS